MSGAGILTMREAAAEVGLGYDRFRKAWRDWVVKLGFPTPFAEPPVAEYGWDAAAVAAWRRARSERRLASADVAEPEPPAEARAARARAALAELQGERA